MANIIQCSVDQRIKITCWSTDHCSVTEEAADYKPEVAVFIIHSVLRRGQTALTAVNSWLRMYLTAARGINMQHSLFQQCHCTFVEESIRSLLFYCFRWYFHKFKLKTSVFILNDSARPLPHMEATLYSMSETVYNPIIQLNIQMIDGGDSGSFPFCVSQVLYTRAKMKDSQIKSEARSSQRDHRLLT